MLRDQVLMQVRRGQSPFVAKRPEWAYDPKLLISRETIEAFQQTDFDTWPRVTLQGKWVEVTLIERPAHDIIYQVFFRGSPRLARDTTAFRQFLTELVESHFGSTVAFRADYVPEVKSWALLAKEVRSAPLYNAEHFSVKFVTLLDLALDEAERE